MHAPVGPIATIDDSTSQAHVDDRRAAPTVMAIADVESNAQALIENVLKPAGVRAWTPGTEGPAPDVLVVDVTQLRGDPLSSLRIQREQGVDAPAIALAAYIPPNRLRDFFRLGVRDVLLKPYRPSELIKAIFELAEPHSAESSPQTLAQELEAAQEVSHHYADEISLLGEIGRAVATLGDLSLILARVTEAADYVTGAEETHIYLTEAGTNEMVLRASKQAGERHAALHRLRVNDMLVGQVFRTGKPLLEQPNPKGSPVKVQTGFFVQSMIMVPLRIRDRIIGVLGVYNPVTARPFNEHQLTLMVMLADWASVALAHAALVQAARSTRRGPEETAIAHPRLLKGLDDAVAAIGPILEGRFGALGKGLAEELQGLSEKLSQLQSLPVAILDHEQADEFVDLPGIARQTAKMLEREAGRKGLKILVENPSPVPMFPAEKDRINKIVEGLASAAVRRTSWGRVVLQTYRFSVRDGEADGYFPPPAYVRLEDGIWGALSVVDTSPGLSPGTVHALTSPETDPGAGKSGRGLSMGEIRMIAESLGGYLWHEKTSDGMAITFALLLA